MKSQSNLKLVTIFLFLTNSIVSQEIIKLKGVVMENDYHEKITWIKSKPVPLVSKDFTVSSLNVSYTQIYFGAKMVDSKQIIMPVRLINQYRDSDWIFFDEISYLLGSRKEIKKGKGIRFKIKDNDTKQRVERGVREYSDIKAIGEAKSFIKYVINNDATELRIRYTNTRDNTYREIKVPKGTKRLKKHFKALIESYNRLNKTYKTNVTF